VKKGGFAGQGKERMLLRKPKGKSYLMWRMQEKKKEGPALSEKGKGERNSQWGENIRTPRIKPKSKEGVFCFGKGGRRGGRGEKRSSGASKDERGPRSAHYLRGGGYHWGKKVESMIEEKILALGRCTPEWGTNGFKGLRVR